MCVCVCVCVGEKEVGVGRRDGERTTKVMEDERGGGEHTPSRFNRDLKSSLFFL